MSQRQFVLGLFVACLIFVLVGVGIAASTYLRDRERESRERSEANRPRKIWERK